MNLQNKKVLVMGLGLIWGGIDIVKWLNRNKVKIIVTDLKRKRELRTSIEKIKGIPVKFILGRHRKSEFQNVGLIIKKPSISENSLYLKNAGEKYTN